MHAWKGGLKTGLYYLCTQAPAYPLPFGVGSLPLAAAAQPVEVRSSLAPAVDVMLEINHPHDTRKINRSTLHRLLSLSATSTTSLSLTNSSTRPVSVPSSDAHIFLLQTHLCLALQFHTEGPIRYPKSSSPPRYSFVAFYLHCPLLTRCTLPASSHTK